MKKRKDPLEGLIEAADFDILGKLIKELASYRPEIRRECFEFLKDHVTFVRMKTQSPGLKPCLHSGGNWNRTYPNWMSTVAGITIWMTMSATSFMNYPRDSKRTKSLVNTDRNFSMKFCHISTAGTPGWTIRFTRLLMRPAIMRKTFENWQSVLKKLAVIGPLTTPDASTVKLAIIRNTWSYVPIV